MDLHAVAATLYPRFTQHLAGPGETTAYLDGGPIGTLFLTSTAAGPCVLGMRASDPPADEPRSALAALRTGFHTRHQPQSLFALRDGTGALRCCRRIPLTAMTVADLAQALGVMRDALQAILAPVFPPHTSGPGIDHGPAGADPAPPPAVSDLDFYDLGGLSDASASRVRESALRLNFISLFNGNPPIREGDQGQLNLWDSCSSSGPEGIQAWRDRLTDRAHHIGRLFHTLAPRSHEFPTTTHDREPH